MPRSQLKPDWERAALLKAEILSRGRIDEAIAYLQTFIAANPEARAAAAGARTVLRRAEALRRGPRGLPELWDKRSQRARAAVRHRA